MAHISVQNGTELYQKVISNVSCDKPQNMALRKVKNHNLNKISCFPLSKSYLDLSE